MALHRLVFKEKHSLKLDELTAEEREFFECFPEDYREFLMEQNGGWLMNSEEAAYTVPITRIFKGVTYHSNTTQVEEFWTFCSYQNQKPGEKFQNGPTSILHEQLDRHEAEAFLPKGVFVIARSLQNSLLALSLREKDYGVMYHWDWYWQYLWHEDFFRDRMKAVLAEYPDHNEIDADPKHPKYGELTDALNFATLVKVADSFTAFKNGLFKREVSEE